MPVKAMVLEERMVRRQTGNDRDAWITADQQGQNSAGVVVDLSDHPSTTRRPGFRYIHVETHLEDVQVHPPVSNVISRGAISLVDDLANSAAVGFISQDSVYGLVWRPVRKPKTENVGLVEGRVETLDCGLFSMLFASGRRRTRSCVRPSYARVVRRNIVRMIACINSGLGRQLVSSICLRYAI